jgi:hypothetical protein
LIPVPTALKEFTMNAIATTSARTASACPGGQHAAGSFQLANGRALTLQPGKASLLRVKQGRVWATLSSELGDHVLVSGSTLHIPAGDRVVIEPWPLQERCPVFFDWDPAPVYMTAAQPTVSVLPVIDSGLAGERLLMGQAFGDLRAALAATGVAAARLALGAARFAIGFVARPRFGAWA